MTPLNYIVRLSYSYRLFPIEKNILAMKKGWVLLYTVRNESVKSFTEDWSLLKCVWKIQKPQNSLLKWLNKFVCLLSTLLAIIVLDFTKYYINPRGWKEKEELNGTYNIKPCFCYLDIKTRIYFDLEKI